MESFVTGTIHVFKVWALAVDWPQVAVSIIAILVVILMRHRLTRLGIWISKRLGKHVGISIPQPIEKTITPAVEALIVSLAVFLCVEAFNLPSSLAVTVERILISVMIICVFAALYALCKPFAKLLEPFRTKTTRVQINWVIGLAKALIFVLGISSVLNVWGIDIGLMITGMGIASAAIALAAQDLVKNLIAGFTNVSEKRYRTGDWIRVDGVIEGIVRKVEFRSTLVERFDMATVHVPNAELANAILINFAHLPHRRISWNISVVYQTTTQQLGQICKEIEEYIDQCGDFVPATDASRYVNVNAFNESSIDIMIYCFAQTHVYGAYMEVKERLVFKIKEIVEGSGTSFALPSRSIYVEADGVRRR